MRRRTFDALATMAGLVLAIVLAIGGGMLLWGHSVISNDVHTQLAAQKIVFPPANSSAIKELPAANAAAMSQYGGQLMTTGAQAQTYADNFIAVHLIEDRRRPDLLAAVGQVAGAAEEHRARPAGADHVPR